MNSGKCRLKKDQRMKINDFLSRFPVNTVVFVVVAGELGMCIALGGLKFFIFGSLLWN